MLQFIGPVKDAWLHKVEQVGLERVAYLPNNAYVVWGNGAALDALDTLAARSSFIQWSGPYHPAYRLAPSLHAIAHMQQNRAEGDEMVDVTVQFYATDYLPQSLERLNALGGSVYLRPARVMNLVNTSLQLPSSQLNAVASWPDVFNVEPWSTPRLYDEVQGQIVAGNVSSLGNLVVPDGPGYLAWLSMHGFPTLPASYPIVDVVDTGFDIGDAENVQHPDLYVNGDPSREDRIVYTANCTNDEPGNDTFGHGTINIGIIGSYNDQMGWPYQDAQGYQIGLGISPFGRVASTKIFNNNGYLRLSACGGQFAGIAENSYTSGATLTSNSWGRDAEGEYDSSAQTYDYMSRDAMAGMPGNQEMLHVFSAGNEGPSSTSIGSPGTAKNVLSVGATENVRDEGVTDGCYSSESNNADDIASFSSRGPTEDGRAKPDLVAPGVHVQGPASQDPSFNGYGVCGMPSGIYYPEDQTLYTWSTGTSHSAPAVAGAVSLLYEYYGRALLPGNEPSPAMLKALLLNSTRYLTGVDADDTLPGKGQGWGGVNLGMLFDGVPRSLVDQNVVFASTGETYEFSSTIDNAAKPLRVSLVWTDAPGSTTGDSYVNDLDLEVTVGGKTYRGNTFAGEFSTSGGSFDEKNNVEQVFLPAGTGDTFTVRVIARNIVGDGLPGNDDMTDQDFALVVYNDSTGVGSGNKLEGVVTDTESGEPVEGAVIELVPNVPEQVYTFRTRSQADGSYMLRLPEGNFTLDVFAYGYKTWHRSDFVISQETTTLNIALEPAALVTMQGKVYDTSNGRPIYAQVNVETENHTLTAFTDPTNGTYSLQLMPGILHDVTVSSIGTESPGRCGNSETCDDIVEPYQKATRTVTPGSTGTVQDFALVANGYACSAPGYERSYIHFTDFEEDNGNFSTNWTSSWQWGVPTSGPENAHSGDKVWATNLDGNYEQYSDNFLTSSHIDLSSYAGQAIVLSWWQWFETSGSDGYDDYVTVEVSNDGGSTWETIYRDRGNAPHWLRQRVLLSNDYAVSTFRIRFALYSREYATHAGYYVDNVGIEANPLTTIYTEDFEDSNGSYVAEALVEDSDNSWEWGIPSSGPGNAHSGSKVWATNLDGNYRDYEESAITSPAINLDGQANKGIILSWWQWVDTEYGYDYAQVEVSKDGGTTWEHIYHTYRSDGWEQQSIELDSSYAVPDFRVRFSIDADFLYNENGFYVDDVQVKSLDYQCFPREGGLVVGQVTDLASGEGVNGVWVGNNHHTTTTFAVPEDPAMGNGFYQLFLPAGSYNLTAKGSGSYLPVTESVQVNQNAATRQNFTISSGWLESHSEPLSVTLEAGEHITLPLHLFNTTTRVVTFTVKERDNGYVPVAVLPVSPTHALARSMPQVGEHSQEADQTEQNGWLSTLVLPEDYPALTSTVAETYQPSHEALLREVEIDVLLLGGEDVSDIQTMLRAYSDIKVVDWFDSSVATPTRYDLLDYDAVLVVTEHSFANPVAMGDVLADYLDSGGKVVQTVPTFYARDEGNWNIQGRFLTEGYSPFVGVDDNILSANLGAFEQEHPIMRGVKEARDSLRQQVDLAPGAHLVASWEDDEFVAIKGTVVALNTFIANGSVWEGDIDLIIHNSLIWLQSFDYVSWLSVAPDGDTVAISETTALSVGISAGAMPPGDYQAHVLAFNEQQQEIAAIPVDMRIDAAGKWTRLNGTVTTSGYCGKNSALVEGAEVKVEASNGQTWVTTTDTDGTYQIWMNSVSTPLHLTIAASDYETYSTELNVTIGEQNVHDANLVWLQPCVEADVEHIEATLNAGERKTVMFHLANNGAVPADGTMKVRSTGDNDPTMWLKIVPENITIEPGAKEPIEVTFDFTTPPTNTVAFQREHSAFLEIISNDPIFPKQSLPVKVTISNAFDDINIVEVGTIMAEEGILAYDVVVQNNIAYIATSDGLSLYDVSDSYHPEQTAFLDTTSLPLYDVEVVGSQAYVIADGGSVGMIDVSMPTSPTLQGDYYPGRFYHIDVVDTLAYVTTRNDPPYTLDIFDVSTSGVFSPLATIELPGEGHSIQVVENYAYIAAGNEGVQIIDISTPTAPVIVGSYSTSSLVTGVKAAGAMLLVVDSEGVHILDISTPTAPTSIASYEVSDATGSVSIVGSMAFVSRGTKGLHVVDVSVPSMPDLLASYDPPGFAHTIAVVDDFLYVATGREGVRILKVQSGDNLSVYLPLVQQ